MLFLVDTCFWKHIQDVFLETTIDLRLVFQRFRWGTTFLVVKELHNYHLDAFFPHQDHYLIPVSSEELSQSLKTLPFLREFDQADQSLIVAALRDHHPILTDDHSLFRTGLSLGIEIMLLPHFSLFLVRAGEIDKRTVSRLLKFWEQHESFKKKELNEFKNELQQIR